MASKKKGGKKSGGASKRYEKPKAKAPAFRGASARKAAPKDTTRKRTPRSNTLPGMEQVRDRTLDNLCEAIGDCRDTLNTTRGEEKGLTASALQRMQARELSIYKHARVELAMIPGTAKLRVRVTKEENEVAVKSKPAEADPEPEPEHTPSEVDGPDGYDTSGEIH